MLDLYITNLAESVFIPPNTLLLKHFFIYISISLSLTLYLSRVGTIAIFIKCNLANAKYVYQKHLLYISISTPLIPSDVSTAFYISPIIIS